MALSNGLSSTVLKPGVCTTATKPLKPYTGQFIYLTDTGALEVWNGTSWAIPSGSSSNPTSSNQFVRKGYVDSVIPTESNLSTRIKSSGNNSIGRLVGTAVSQNDQQVIMQSGTKSVTLVVNDGGVSNLSFSPVFPNGLISVVASIGSNSGAISVSTYNYTLSGCNIKVYAADSAYVNNNSIPADLFIGTTSINYIAVGW